MTLRKVEPQDVPFLYQWENDADAWADGSNHNPLSQKDLRDYVSSSTGDIFRDGQLRLIVETEGCVVGCADLFDVDSRNRRAAIGIYIAPEYRAKGYGTQALTELVRYAFDFLHFRVLYSVIRVSNQPCIKIHEQAHFEPTSVLRGWTLEDDAIIMLKTNNLERGL
ncbi:MAG: GNAT family N-acetyltransferase [Paludibacteraceae bacterium]|nr:GNAT family N-acetyltransferase [Paludibacteraceae bacterium]